VNDPTDGTVFDALHRLFGAGEFTGDDAEWHRWRAQEISKIKAYRTKRNVDPFELVRAAQYCRRHGIWIRAHWELYEHLAAANREELDRQRAAEIADLDGLIEDALAIELTNPDSPWVDRLIRAAGPARKEVYDAWKQWSSASQRRDGTAPTAPSTGPAGARPGGRP
jgi:hypothetical protein